MKLSIHNTIKGKPISIEDSTGYKWMECNGVRVNLGYGWTNIDANWSDIFELITQDGYASSAELNNDHRSNDEFVSRQLFMVDIDAGMNLIELQSNDFYNACGAGFYTTPSHKVDSPRFRIMFRTETEICNSELARLLIIGLMRLYDYADPACKDSTRIFYGCINACNSECTDRVIPDIVVAEIIQQEIGLQEARFIETEQRDYAPITDINKRKIIELLKNTFVGDYHIWRNVGWGLKNAGFALHDFQYITQGMMSQKTSRAAADIWNDGKNISGGCTIGTVIHLLKERHGKDCLNLTDDDNLIAIETKINETKVMIAKWQKQ